MKSRFPLFVCLCMLTEAVSMAQVPPQIQEYRNEPRGDYQSQRRGVMDWNKVRTVFHNTTELASWPDGMAAEWPKGSGHNYIGGFYILIGARVRLSDGNAITPIEGHYLKFYDFDPALGIQYGWDLEPVPGYTSASGTSPAMSKSPGTWPGNWNNKWHGMDGTDSIHATQETFFVVDDSKDAEFARPPYNFFPVIGDTLRKGLGLRVETRGMQWNDSLANDMFFFVYDVVNLSDRDYDTTAFGFFLDSGVGSFQMSAPAQTVFYSRSLNMIYAKATEGIGYPDNWLTGYAGILFVETPKRDSVDTAAVGLGSVHTQRKGTTPYPWPQNDDILWSKMTSGQFDTSANRDIITVVASLATFSLPKYATRRIGLAFVFASDSAQLLEKATRASLMARKGYRSLLQISEVQPHDAGLGLPSKILLEQNYPNPFNPTTTIRYALPQRSHVTLTVFNTLGQQVAGLASGEIDAGDHEVKFNAASLASGVYFYRLMAGSVAETKTMLIVK